MFVEAVELAVVLETADDVLGFTVLGKLVRLLTDALTGVVPGGVLLVTFIGGLDVVEADGVGWFVTFVCVVIVGCVPLFVSTVVVAEAGGVGKLAVAVAILDCEGKPGDPVDVVPTTAPVLGDIIIVLGDATTVLGDIITTLDIVSVLDGITVLDVISTVPDESIAVLGDTITVLCDIITVLGDIITVLGDIIAGLGDIITGVDDIITGVDGDISTD